MTDPVSDIARRARLLRIADLAHDHLVLVTDISPTPAGEGRKGRIVGLS